MEHWRDRAFAARKILVEALATTPLVSGGIPADVPITDVCSVAGIEPDLLQQATGVYESLHYANRRPLRVTFVPVYLSPQQHAALGAWCRRNVFKPTNLIRSLVVEYLCRPVEPRGAIAVRRAAEVRSREDYYRKINLRLPRPMHRALSARARAAGRTVSVHARALVLTFLQGSPVVPAPARSYTLRECQALEPSFLLPASLREAAEQVVGA